VACAKGCVLKIATVIGRGETAELSITSASQGCSSSRSTVGSVKVLLCRPVQNAGSVEQRKDLQNPYV
jgi:hypothetical protein